MHCACSKGEADFGFAPSFPFLFFPRICRDVHTNSTNSEFTIEHIIVQFYFHFHYQFYTSENDVFYFFKLLDYIYIKK